MRTDTFTLENIKQDFISAEKHYSNDRLEYRIVQIVAGILLILSLVFWIRASDFIPTAYIIPILFSPHPIYQSVKLILLIKKRIERKKEIIAAFERSDISISREKLNCISEELINEPYVTGNRRHSTRYLSFYNFKSGKRWRVPLIAHYNWSKEFKMSSQGLENLSLVGDEFYYVSLQANHEIAYIYPCEYFVPDKSLRILK